jgi:hypothetical protein
VNTLSKSGDEGNLLALHPTVKPVAMIADAILDCSARGDIVLDNFSGVGSTILAAERSAESAMRSRSIPCTSIPQSAMGEAHGEKAVCAATGKCFDQVEVLNG